MTVSEKRKTSDALKKINPITGKGLWESIEAEWLKLYRKGQEKKGLSSIKKVTYTDEWLCEAYMDTDYSSLSIADFEQTIRDYMAYCISSNSTDDNDE